MNSGSLEEGSNFNFGGAYRLPSTCLDTSLGFSAPVRGGIAVDCAGCAKHKLPYIYFRYPSHVILMKV